jgi:cytochrome b
MLHDRRDDTLLRSKALAFQRPDFAPFSASLAKGMPPMVKRPAPRLVMLPLRVWDIAIRLFHWSLLPLIIGSYVSITLADGPEALLWMRVHVICGEMMLGLLVFRLIWGLIGSDTARFAMFLRTPATALRSLAHMFRRGPDTEIGHNPAGGWMVMIMLLLIAVQVITGLCANDDGSTEGPLVKYIGKALSNKISDLHGVNFNILVAAIVVHMAAILVYAVVKKHNLVRPMLTGKKRLPAAQRAPRMASPWLALLSLVVAAAISVGVAVM